MAVNLPTNELNETYCLNDRRVIFDGNRQTLYCHVAKTGSTYWMRVFNIIIMNLDNTNPFALQRGLVHRDTMDKWTFEHAHTIDTSGWFKFLFVRNPFERILSTYIDKFVSPNIYYFFIAKYMIQSERKNPNKQALECGHDIAFEEFIRAVVSKETPDEHWCPVYRICDVTNINYSFIGKMETFVKDSEAVLHKVDKDHLIKTNTNQSETNNDILTINIKRAFDFESLRFFNGLNCSFLDFTFALQRVWKVLQLKGIIDHMQMFPFPSRIHSSVTEESFRAAVQHAVQMSFKIYSPSDLRKHVLFKAYSVLPNDLQNHFIQHFKYDFSMFGYATILEKQKLNIEWNPF
ncbi:hypothetical protein FSP39_020823 [Pinctada imbricata]|uniref:Carbohydrate sulfotransferase n=1 Tax=Pinctada imbricata TaxID=66713 RepID=A0AA88YJM4_PINIB|nr:hypothetical protein FSP39_020823 [Pinctada imbricata]